MTEMLINLLPYREERRKAGRRQMAVLTAGVFGVGAGIALLVHVVFAGYILQQDERNKFLQSENRQLDKKIEEIKTLRESIEAVRAQQQIIEQLQSDRSAPVQILEQMVRLTPSGVYLKAIKQTGDKVNISGYAQSNDLVSTMMSSLQESPFLERPELVEIKAATVGTRRLSEFSVNFSIRKAKTADSKGVDPKAKPAAAGSLVITESAPNAPAVAPGQPAAAAMVPAATTVAPPVAAPLPVPDTSRAATPVVKKESK